MGNERQILPESVIRTHMDKKQAQNKAAKYLAQVAEDTDTDAEAFAVICLMYSAFISVLRQNGVEIV